MNSGLQDSIGPAREMNRHGRLYRPLVRPSTVCIAAVMIMLLWKNTEALGIIAEDEPGVVETIGMFTGRIGCPVFVVCVAGFWLILERETGAFGWLVETEWVAPVDKHLVGRFNEGDGLEFRPERHGEVHRGSESVAKGVTVPGLIRALFLMRTLPICLPTGINLHVDAAYRETRTEKVD